LEILYDRGLLRNLLRKAMYGTWGKEPTDRFKRVRYRRLWVSAVLITTIVSITPLIISTAYNYAQYRRALFDEMMHPISMLVVNVKRALEFSLEERLKALMYIVKANDIGRLAQEEHLKKIRADLKESFGNFVDLGLIDAYGDVVAYVGPRDLEAKLHSVNYSQEDWFNEVQQKGTFVSSVFRGYRGNPHFVIAIRTRNAAGDLFILRSTLDMELLTGQIPTFDEKDSTDAFIVGTNGLLQTVTRSGLKPLQKSPVPLPPYSAQKTTGVQVESDGKKMMLGYAYVENTPFIFIMIRPIPDLMRNWLTLRRNLVGFLAGSIVIILLLIAGVSSVLVSRIRETDQAHEKALHQVEYSAKMASIGRLAAGVAHEINNPLAIINEKAGLLQDIILAGADFPKRDKSLQIIESILNSVERGSTITHRLLGFARHLEPSVQTIDLKYLLNEVLSFLEKEAVFRNIEVSVEFEEGLPTIESDKGQLQQVFLNIINNSFEAIEKDGKVNISVYLSDAGNVKIAVSDNGRGIKEVDIPHVFEPFFSTKAKGTGLGLSITYGIVKKLRGNIAVESREDGGTTFTVTLPVNR
jgi:two-component system, NtrC family, sensor kinase